MKKRVKTELAVMAARVLSNVKFDKMEDKEKFALLRALRPMKRVAEDYDGFVKDVSERLKPEEFDRLVAKEQSGQEYTTEESARVRKYNEDVRECLRTEEQKEVDLDFEPLSEEAVMRLAKSNPDMSVGTVSELMDLLVGREEEKKDDAPDDRG